MSAALAGRRALVIGGGSGIGYGDDELSPAVVYYAALIDVPDQGAAARGDA